MDKKFFKPSLELTRIISDEWGKLGVFVVPYEQNVISLQEHLNEVRDTIPQRIKMTNSNLVHRLVLIYKKPIHLLMFKNKNVVPKIRNFYADRWHLSSRTTDKLMIEFLEWAKKNSGFKANKFSYEIKNGRLYLDCTKVLKEHKRLEKIQKNAKKRDVVEISIDELEERRDSCIDKIT